VSQGTPYYEKFIQTYPSIAALAKANLDEVLKLWQGLGYYSRARNLHAAANDIMERFGGTFPSEYEEILSLKGIGPYSAAAIGSFAYGLPYVVVDGNVLRFISRYFGIKTSIDLAPTKNKIQDLAQRMQDEVDPAEFNQAIMEFGALCCTFKNPSCTQCILQPECKAFHNNQVSNIPVRTKKIKKRKRHFHFHILLDKAGNTLVAQRGPKDVWHGLFQFPLFEAKHPNHAGKLHEVIDIGTKKMTTTVYGPYKQSLTHQHISGTFYVHQLRIKMKRSWIGEYRMLGISELHNLPWPRIISHFLEKESLSIIK